MPSAEPSTPLRRTSICTVDRSAQTPTAVGLTRRAVLRSMIAGLGLSVAVDAAAPVLPAAAAAAAARPGWIPIAGQEQGQVYLRRPPRRHAAPPVVIYHHGAGGTAESVLANPYERRLLDILGDAGNLVMVSDFGGNQWGNEIDHHYFTDLIALANDFGGRRGPVGLVGTSMGGGASLSFAGTHPDQVACVVGILPVIDLSDLQALTPTSVNAAFAPAYSDNLHGPRHSPVVMSRLPHVHGGKRTSRFTGVPLDIWFGTADEVCVPDAARRFARRVRRREGAQVRLHPLRGAGHTVDAIGLVDPHKVARFLRSHLSARR